MGSSGKTSKRGNDAQHVNVMMRVARSLFAGGTCEDSCGGRAFKIVSLLVAIACGVAHFYENFGYLRHLQRVPQKELAQASALQTENAFYYSYYQELVHASSASEGLAQIVWDTRSEYPDTLNAMRRFNVYQEVFLGLTHRALRCLGVHLDEWSLFRNTILVVNAIGHSALSMLASEISGNPFAGISCFVLAFLNRFQISRLGNYTSANLREVWGIPVLWMQTYCLLRILMRSGGRCRGDCPILWSCFGCLTFVFIILWQFSPFLLLLQATALYFIYLVCGFSELRYVVSHAVNVYIVAMVLAIVVHFGSPYLATSPFLFQLAGLRVAISLRSCFGVPFSGGRSSGRCAWLSSRIADVCEGIVAVVVFLAVRKAAEPFATADTHVYEILCTKVATVNDMLPLAMRLPVKHLPTCTEPSFNARLYLIMGVFNVIESASLNLYRDSSASGAAILASVLVVLRYILGCLRRCVTGSMQEKRDKSVKQTASPAAGDTVAKTTHPDGLRKRKGANPIATDKARSEQPQSREHPKTVGSYGLEADRAEEAAHLFFVMQSALFFVLGALINRLRVAFGPPMMVLAACVFGPRLFPLRFLVRNHFTKAVVVLFGLHCAHLAWLTQLLPCVNNKEGVCQHFTDKASNEGDMADLSDWINRALKPGVPLLTSMNLGGSLRLFTKASLVVHPQFESENLRKRVQLGYELYHCGSEASFAQTMRKLHAEVVIFEYFRCFFTPYTLDDRRKNCISGKHKPEDQLCVKLHAGSRYFELIFVNGGYAAFRLRDHPLRDNELTASEVKTTLASADTWRSFVDTCARDQGDVCGPRLMEASATWHHGLKRPEVARTLRALTEKKFGKHNGYVAYYSGRYLDYDANMGNAAGERYAQAVRAFPNNPFILKEYIMWLDMVAKDTKTITQLLEERKGTKQRTGKPTPLLLLDGNIAGSLLCETAVSARTLGMKSFGDSLWARALDVAPFSECVKHNWPLIEATRNISEVYTVWTQARLMLKGGVQHEVNSHNQPCARFLGDRPFLLNPHVTSEEVGRNSSVFGR
eukprot:TRINITY_DN5131_c0_g6_i1.p1 TRINITY_DN5131_c0_g6~~TRINITY_DN5131_c0_g6_i1.p1  ORF type:complete len:1044 (-),score=95.90 TRINITY_DN5131_c0_g6_i1:35-3166(-)